MSAVIGVSQCSFLVLRDFDNRKVGTPMINQIKRPADGQVLPTLI